MGWLKKDEEIINIEEDWNFLYFKVQVWNIVTIYKIWMWIKLFLRYKQDIECLEFLFEIVKT